MYVRTFGTWSILESSNKEYPDREFVEPKDKEGKKSP